MSSVFFEDLIDQALVEAKGLDIYTFAIYHDQESGFVSICIDTKENSERHIAESNEYCMKYFYQMIDKGDLKQAALWQAKIGRSLSLGDFTAVNLTRKEIGDIAIDDSFYLTMVKAIREKSGNIATQSTFGSSLLFCCSTANEEVGLAWVAGISRVR